MKYLTIRKLSKNQFLWAEVKIENGFEKEFSWVDFKTSQLLSSIFGAEPSEIADSLDRPSKLDHLIKVPISVVEAY